MTNRLLPAALIIAAIAVFLVYVRPTFVGPIADLSANATQYDAALAAADRYDAREAELARERDQLPPDQLARLSTFLPDGVDNVRMILDLTALAGRTGVSLSGFNIKSNAADGGSSGSQLASGSLIDSVDLSVTATGTYSSFRSFLSGIETSLRPMDLVNLEVKGSPTGVYTFDMTLRIYWLR